MINNEEILRCIDPIINTEIEHYGVKGMKWGIRRRISRVFEKASNATEDALRNLSDSRLHEKLNPLIDKIWGPYEAPRPYYDSTAEDHIDVSQIHSKLLSDMSDAELKWVTDRIDEEFAEQDAKKEWEEANKVGPTNLISYFRWKSPLAYVTYATFKEYRRKQDADIKASIKRVERVMTTPSK